MSADDLIAKPSRPTPRRVAWGSLLADAPWDGRPRAAAPIHVPATEAGRAADPEAGDSNAGHGATPRTRKRVPFGALLTDAPWTPRTAPPSPAVAVAHDLGPIAAAV